MSADSELVEFIRKHLKTYGEKPLRQQLLKDGVPPEQIEAALAEASAADRFPRRKKSALLRVTAGAALLLAAALYLGSRKRPADSGPGADRGGRDFYTSPDQIFRGHYGYMLKLPSGYEAEGGYQDALKTHEVVHIFPKGTDHTHFINEGLYGQLGILRLEAAPRRVPQGLIGVETLRAWVKNRMALEKSSYKGGVPSIRQQIVHGMPGFVVEVSEPFPSAKAYLVGQKVYYTLFGGTEDALFTGILSSLIEVAPTDEPGK